MNEIVWTQRNSVFDAFRTREIGLKFIILVHLPTSFVVTSSRGVPSENQNRPFLWGYCDEHFLLGRFRCPCPPVATSKLIN